MPTEKEVSEALKEADAQDAILSDWPHGGGKSMWTMKILASALREEREKLGKAEAELADYQTRYDQACAGRVAFMEERDEARATYEALP